MHLLRNTAASAAAAALAIALAIAPSIADAPGGAPMPLRFAYGTSSATVEGRVPQHGAVTYSLVAEAGQSMRVDIFNGAGVLAPVAVGLPGAAPHVNGPFQTWSGTIPSSGPFRIVLRAEPGSGGPAGYSMTVSISGNGSAHPQRIEEVDFADGTVVFGKETYRLHNGLATPPADDKLFHLGTRNPIFGYVDGYPAEVAVLFLDSDDGGTGQFAAIDVFTLRHGKPVLVATLLGGDRAEGGYRAARIEKGRLVVEVYGAPGGACCPTYIDSVRYRFVRGKLTQDGKPARRATDQRNGYS